MVIDLTQDSSSDELDLVQVSFPGGLTNGNMKLGTQAPTDFDESQQLLKQFQLRTIRPPQEFPVPATKTESTPESHSKYENQAKPPQSDTASASSSKKRRRGSASTTSNSVVPDHGHDRDFPSGHHGLSSFYGVEGLSPHVTQVKKKEVKRSEVGLCRSSHTFKPQQSFQGRNIWWGIASRKLQAISGPPVHLCIDKASRKIEFNFEFINSYKLQQGVERVDLNFCAGCDCSDCHPDSCICLSQEIDSDKRIMPYKPGRDGKIVLRSDFMKRKAMIFECSSLCNCGQNCWNRVVEAGRTVRLEVFETENRGLGLRSPDAIQAGEYIDSYLGEIVSRETADDREGAMGDAASYLFSLDFFSEEDVYVVDGRKYGSVTRFMNHSCEPNCKMFSVSHNHSEDRIFEMAFFALTDIPAFTEFTFDYYPNWKQDEPSEIDPDAVKCLCGATKCRGQLWPNQRKTMQ